MQNERGRVGCREAEFQHVSDDEGDGSLNRECIATHIAEPDFCAGGGFRT